jgi:hypothetical protein
MTNQEFNYFNKHGVMPPKKRTEYVLMVGNQIVEKGDYALLVWKKKQLEKEGNKFAKIVKI